MNRKIMHYIEVLSKQIKKKWKKIEKKFRNFYTPRRVNDEITTETYNLF